MQNIPRRLKLLEKKLASLPVDSDTMLVSELDGFVAGILVCPDLIMPSEWLPLIWGGNEEADPTFENARQAEQLMGLVMEHLYEERSVKAGMDPIGSSIFGSVTWSPASSARRSPCVSRRIHLYPVEVSGLAPQSHSRLPNTLWRDGTKLQLGAPGTLHPHGHQPATFSHLRQWPKPSP
jgi:hypothetical protein